MFKLTSLAIVAGLATMILFSCSGSQRMPIEPTAEASELGTNLIVGTRLVRLNAGAGLDHEVSIPEAEYFERLQQLYAAAPVTTQTAHLGYFTQNSFLLTEGVLWLSAEDRAGLSDEQLTDLAQLEADIEFTHTVRRSSRASIIVGKEAYHDNLYLDMFGFFPSFHYFAYATLIDSDGEFIPLYHLPLFNFGNVHGNWAEWGFEMDRADLEGIHTLRAAIFSQPYPTTLDEAVEEVSVELNFYQGDPVGAAYEGELGWFFNLLEPD